MKLIWKSIQCILLAAIGYILFCAICYTCGVPPKGWPTLIGGVLYGIIVNPVRICFGKKSSLPNVRT